MRMRALIRRICQQMLRDKRTLGLLFFAPLFVLTLMYFIFNGNTVNLRLGVVSIDKSLVQAFEKSDIDIETYVKATDQTVISDNLDGLLQNNNGDYKLTLQNSDPSKSKALQMKVNQIILAQHQVMQYNLQLKGLQNNLQLNVKAPETEAHYIYGNSGTTFFDVLYPILIGFFVFFFVFLISGIGLLRERTTGTLERLMSTPVRRVEVITGYLAGYGIFAVIQTIIIISYSITVLNITLVGSIWNVLLINLLMAFAALSLGILLSTFAASEFQMLQFIPIVIIPQVFFAGIFPLEGMAGWLRVLARIMPIYYGADALKGVMYKGWGIGDIGGDIFALILFAAVFIALNILALKKYRKL